MDTASDLTVRDRKRPQRIPQRLTFLGVLLGSALLGCNDDALIADYNDLPIAEAQVVHPQTGAIVQMQLDGSLAPVTFPYSGAPVRIVLTAQNSRDPDGTIEEYRWLSGNRVPDAGVPRPPLRRVPEGVDTAWPADEAMTTVDLGPGLWAFSLWVRDDNGAWSAPDTIRVIIGSATSPSGDAGTVAAAAMDGGINTNPASTLDSGR